MHVIIYQFIVNPDAKDEFVHHWTELSKYMQEEGGAILSRLHHSKHLEYIAYVQWPSKGEWERAFDSLSMEAHAHREAMRQLCASQSVLHELSLLVDL